MQKKIIIALLLFSLLSPLHSMRANELTQVSSDFKDLFANIDNENDDEITRKIKKICKLCVGCLATNRLFVNGCEITCPITGLRGATGPQGPTPVFEYGYVYNTSDQINIPVNTDITFDTNGPMSLGITHTPGTGIVTVNVSGTYTVDIAVTGQARNQVTLQVNNVPVSGGLYGTGTGPSLNHGEIVINLVAGDELSLHLVASDTGNLDLLPVGAGAGSFNNVNAAMRVQQIR